jgi:hypothetical protein
MINAIGDFSHRKHYRDFASEMPKRFSSLGFEELRPQDVAYRLFGNLQAGDKIAITGRFVDQNGATNTSTISQIVSALESRGLIVRLVQGGGAMEDFCFMKSAKKELVGKYVDLFQEGTCTKFSHFSR